MIACALCWRCAGQNKNTSTQTFVTAARRQCVAVRAQGTATVDQVKMNIAKDVTELIGAWADACV